MSYRPGADLGFIKGGGGLSQGTIISWVEVCEAHFPACQACWKLGGSGGMPPQENFEKLMLKYCNLETFPHKIPNIF